MDSRASKILRLVTSQRNQHNNVNNLYDGLQTEIYDGPGYMEIDKELLTQESTCCKNANNEENKENSHSEVIQLEGIVKETTNVEAVETYHLEGEKIESSLVPYDDSDTTLSEDDALTATLRASEVNKSSSSSSLSRSSSTSSSFSSSSSSSSDSDSSQSPKVPPRPSTSTKDNRDLYEANDENFIEQTSPQQQNEERDTGTRHSRKSQEHHDYQISPLNSDESEADLSDGDPTFVSDEPARRRNYIFAASDTSSSSSVTSESTPQVRGRKRTRKPEKWKQNKAKRLRDAKRGANEIGSCIWKYLKALSDEVEGEEVEVIFYSDNCCGQNKNKYITTLYMFAVHTLNIKSITHNFLIRGHTQNEAESVHSLIEKEVKKNLKSGPIYTPDQYIALIKNAKKSQPALNVHELSFESFYDLKLLQEEWGYNFSKNTEGGNVNWNEIKSLKITKESTKFFYKTSYLDDSYKEVNVRNKRKKLEPITAVRLSAAYTEKQKLSANKTKDLKELISKALIPSFYTSFYDSIL